MAPSRIVGAGGALTFFALVSLGCPGAGFRGPRPSAHAAPSAAARAGAPSYSLYPHQLFDRPLAGSTAHRYDLDIAGPRYLRLAIEQLGVEVSAVLLAPDGTPVATADGAHRWRQVKLLSATLASPGRYALLVKAADPIGAAGRYRAELQESRPPLPSDRDRVVAERSLAEGERLLEEQVVESARGAVGRLETALAAWRRTGDCGGEIATLDALSRGHRTLGDWELARRQAEQASVLADAAGEAEAQAKAWLQLALVRPEQDPELYRDVAELATDLGQDATRAEAFFRLGLLEARRGDNPLALALFELADQLFDRGDERGHARVRTEMGLMLQKLGDSQAALATLQSSLRVGRQLRDLQLEANARYHLAALQLTAGRLQEALDLYRRASALYASIGETWDAVLATTEVGLTELYLDNREEARRQLARAATLSDQLPEDLANKLKPHVILQVAEVERLAGDLANARRHAQEALQIGRRFKDRAQQIYALHKLGQVRALLGEPESAMTDLEEAARLAEESRDRQLLARVRSEQARVLHATGRLERALQRSSEALAYARGGDLESAIRALQAKIERDQGRFETARGSIEQALAIIEGERQEVASPQNQISLLAARRPTYELAIDILMRLERSHPGAGYAGEAFLASERGRARGLLDLLRETRSEPWRAADPELARRHDANERRITDLFKQMIELSVRPSRSAAAGELEAALREAQSESRLIGEEIGRLKRGALDHQNALDGGDRRLVDLARVRSLLDDQTALLEYAAGEETTYLFVVTREGLTGFDLAITSARLATLVDEMQPSLRADGRRLYSTYLRTASSLHGLLIAPALKALAGKPRLLIVPDGSLHTLSFAALLTAPAGGDGANRYDLPYLLRERLISYLPSAAVFVQLHAARVAGTPRDLFVGFGNPLRPLRPLRKAAGQAPAGSPQSTPEGRRRERSAGDVEDAGRRIDDEGPVMRSLRQAGLDQLPPLGFAQQEVTGIASLFRPEQAAVFLGADASELRVKTDPRLFAARYIHFATHGLLNEDPDLSGLLLAADGGEDGLLQTRDVASLKLNADLVVLSACRTALGNRVPGEGVIGLPRAFLHAGAASVLVSLWPVDDESTAALMIEFYRHLAENGDRGEALQRAQLDLLRRQPYSFPYYWAPFILVGLPR